MKYKYCYAVLLLVSICLIGCQRYPDAVDSQGKSIYLSDYQGKWVLINYWATWCKPCLTELPELDALHHTHDQIVVLGVSFDGLPDTQIRTFAASIPINFPLLSQFPMARWGVTNIPSLPVTLSKQ